MQIQINFFSVFCSLICIASYEIKTPKWLCFAILSQVLFNTFSVDLYGKLYNEIS